MSTIEQITSKRFYDNENESGLDRLKNLYKDVYNGVSRYEANIVVNTFANTFLAGAFWRALFGSNTILKEFQVRHNTTVFMGKTDIKKQLLWFTFERIADRGLRFGLRCAFLSGTIGFLVANSFVYRKELHILDVPVSVGTAFALNRYNAGLKAISSAFVIGFVPGLASVCLLKSLFWYQGLTLKDWLDQMNRDLNRDRIVEIKEDECK